MAAYVIVDLEVTDPARYASSVSGCRRPLLPTGAASWCGAASTRSSRAAGARGVW